MRPFLGSVLASLLLWSASAFAEEETHWSYQGKSGPSQWGTLKPEYQTCKLGKVQSPIDIQGEKAADLPALQFDYRTVPLHLVNNGHTLQVVVPPGSFLIVGDKRYQLTQFHFHHPAENRLHGKGFPLEAHLVHQDGEGNLAVVGVLLATGKANAAIAALWKHLPPKGKESTPEGVSVDPAGLLPTKRAYFTYTGSLTTPPCSESVTWFLLRTPVSVSKEEVATFAAEYPGNARPVQPLNGRSVQASK